jgi:spore coat polysaccharide biosynthesis protein SpsF
LTNPISVFLTVRYSSSRLPGKCLEKIGNFSVLEHMVLRVRAAGFYPVVCTSSDVSDDKVCNEAARLNVPCFRGSLLNKIQRWRDCAVAFNLDFIHILDVDDPFFDSDEVLESVAVFQNLELDLLKTSPRSDSGFASVGMTVSLNFLEKLIGRIGQLASQDLDVIPWQLISDPNDKISVMPNKYIIQGDTQLRLTLDYPEDLVLLNKLAKIFGPAGNRVEIETYLVDNLDLVMINRERTTDFLNNKMVSLEKNFGITKSREG